jgi:hypothetical protein
MTCVHPVPFTFPTLPLIMSSRGSLRVPCRCSQCAATFEGYAFQTKQVVRKHQAIDWQRLPIHVLDEIPQDRPDSTKLLNGPEIPEANTPEPDLNDNKDGEPENWDLDDNKPPVHQDADLDPMPAGEHPPPILQYPQAIPAPVPQPLHTVEEVFIPAGLDPDPDPWVDAMGDEAEPLGIPAMKGEPYIRLAYLQAVMGNVYGKLTWEHATQQLNNTLDCLSLAQPLPVHPRPVRTLQSARRRLGIDPDQYITQYSICPICWKHHTPQEFKDLASPDCSTRNCTGKVYTLKDGHHVPSLIVPHVSLIDSLRQMFMRPGFTKLVERKVDHQPGRNSDEDFLMKDMHDGEMWYRSTTGTTREIGSMGTIHDTPSNGAEIPTKLFFHRFGLQLTLNTDW